MTTKNYVSLKLAKELKAIGFDNYCNYMYNVYTSKFVYDGVPDHPESHEKGEVRVYDIYNKNSENTKHQYSMPHVFDVQLWFLKQKGFIITPYWDDEGEEYDVKPEWCCRVRCSNYGVDTYITACDSYEDALNRGLISACHSYKLYHEAVSPLMKSLL
jgi:hypothetical protein